MVLLAWSLITYKLYFELIVVQFLTIFTLQVFCQSRKEMTPVYFTVTLVHRYTVLYRQKTKSSNVLLFKHADEFIIHVFINYAEKEIYKKYKCRRAGKGRRCCLRGRIVSFLCHASSFAPG